MKRFCLEDLKSVAEFGKNISSIDEDVEDLRLAFNLTLRPTFLEEFAGKYYGRRKLEAPLKELWLYGLYQHYLVAVLKMLDVSLVERLFLPNRHDLEKSFNYDGLHEALGDFENLKMIVCGREGHNCDFSWSVCEQDINIFGGEFCNIGASYFQKFVDRAFVNVTSLESVVYYDFEEHSIVDIYKRKNLRGGLSLIEDVGDLSLVE